MNMTKKTIGLIILISSILWFSCARIGTLTGGEKDETPPQIIGSNPAEKTTNFSGKKITIIFDEYFQLNNLEGIFLSSPMLNEKPEFKIKKRSLIVKFNEKLLDTTTYTFSFGDAIADFNENNPIKNYKFIISTGNIVDTFAVSGSVRDAFSHEPEKKMFVMLYRAYKDSTPMTERPYYIAKTDTIGKFEFDYIKPGNYRIFALNDFDANYYFNIPDEKIAYTDTFIVPKIEIKERTDFLKAGTIRYSLPDSSVVDTIKNDTIIKSIKNIYYPDNLHLFSFTEDRQSQYIKKANRPSRGQCVFEYNKNIDSIMINALDTKIKIKDILIEKTDTGKIVTYWLRDSLVYNKDSLDFIINFHNKDSMENIILESDTFNLFYDTKADSLNEKYTEINLSNKEHNYFDNYKIETKMPILKFDTSKIKLYEIIDTMVIDPKKQNIVKIQRQTYDKIFFAFRRPIVKDFSLRLLNNQENKNWYITKFNSDKDEIECKITDKNVLKLDTIKLVVHYDNDFFLNQVQQFYDTLELKIEKQKILSIKRKDADTIKINFNKPINSDIKISILNKSFEEYGRKINTKNENEIILKITDNLIKETDSLILKIKVTDYTDSLNNKIFFEDSVSAILVHKKQNIVKSLRYKKNKFYINFKNKLINDVNIKPLNFTINNVWFSKKHNSTNDSISFTITDKFVSKMDTIKLDISYDILTKNKKTEIKHDTISLAISKIKRKKHSKKRITKVAVSIDLPIKYDIKTDSTRLRKFDISYKWKGNYSYIIRIDSTAFTDIFNFYNKDSEVKFKVLHENYFGKILLNISNIKHISEENFFHKKNHLHTDTSLIKVEMRDSINRDSVIKQTAINDSISGSMLDKGKIIILLSDEDGKIIRKKEIRKNVNLIFDKLSPGDYSIKLIYDKNENDKWDTGDYLKNIQPERILIYDKKINVRSKWTSEIDWNIEFK